MNSERRKILAGIAAAYVEIVGSLESIEADLESVKDEEEDAFNNMPESFQEGERGDSAREAIENLERAIDALDLFLGEEIEGLIENARA